MLSKGVFIVGCPGSGTSRLRTAVTSHPDMAIGLERYASRALRGELTHSDFEADRFFSIQANDTYIDLNQFEKIYDNLRSKYKSAHFHGDTIPRGYLTFDQLTHCFDKTYFLMCIRNIFSVAASYESHRRGRTNWDPSWDYKVAVKHWNVSIKKTLEFMSYIPILPVIYEEMRAGTEMVHRIGSFLNVRLESFDRAFLQMDKSRGPIEEDRLPEEATAYIFRYADFSGYRRLCELALDAPNYNSGHIIRGKIPRLVDKYSADDELVIDYNSWQLEGTPYMMRGPKPMGQIEDAIVFLGSAATFGRLVHRPFARILEEKLGVPVFNFGVGGARPDIYLDYQPIKDILARCRAVVVEVMSARGYKTCLFTPNFADSNVGIAPEEARLKVKPLFGDASFVDHVYKVALEKKRSSDLFKALCELRTTYISDMLEIARIVGSKAVLLYFSQRDPTYISTPTDYDAWSGGFPHFVDEHIIDLLKISFRYYVQHVSSSGLPSPCHDKSTGELVPIFKRENPTHNIYYPSQEMHDEVSSKLLPVLDMLLKQR